MKVLIIDDYFDYAKTLTDNFCMKGYDAEFSLHSSQVVEFALEKKPEWVVLDFRLPFKSGLDVFKELKEIADFEFSVVFYSNYADEPEVVKELKALNIPEKVIIPKSTDLDYDVSAKLIPALEAGFLKIGGQNHG